MARSAIINIGTIVSGDLLAPFVAGDTIVMEGDCIAYIGAQAGAHVDAADLVVDAAGATLAPGLIDSHCHLAFGDYTPRQNTVGFLESYTHGGISRVFSASEVHTPGRPRDPDGVVALAVAAQRCFSNFRPGGISAHGGSVILEPGLTEAHFAELERQGVRQAKAGFGAVAANKEYAPIVRAAQRHRIVVMMHTGGASIPGSAAVTGDDLLSVLPDIAGHVNGGPTAMSDADNERVVRETTMALQVVQAGNLRSTLAIVRLAQQYDQLHRLLIASDTPTGTGMIPCGVIKSIVEVSSLAPLAPAIALAAATGNVARVHKIEAGIIASGRPADVVILDAPLGSYGKDALDAIARGDMPSVSHLFTSGELRYGLSRNTPPPTRPVRLIRDDRPRPVT